MENNCQKDSKIDQNHAEHAMESKVVIEESKHVPVSAEGPKNPRKHVVKGRKPTKSTKPKARTTKKEASNQSIRDFFPKMSKVKENEVNVEAEKVEIEVDENSHQENGNNKGEGLDSVKMFIRGENSSLSLKIGEYQVTRQSDEKSPVAAQISSFAPHLEEKLELNIENKNSQVDQLKVCQVNGDQMDLSMCSKHQTKPAECGKNEKGKSSLDKQAEL